MSKPEIIPAHPVRRREDRAYLTAPVTPDERERARANATKAGVSLAEYIRQRCCR